MAETTLLRSSAIVQNASVGTSKPAQVNTGALPLVQVKPPPVGPQVKEGQQQPLQILPPRNPNGPVQTGALPMVQIKMTPNGPQRDDGRSDSVVIKNNRQTVAAGGLPMVQVKMENGKPQVQTVPNVQAAGPHIQSAPVAVSQPRVARISAPRPVQVYPQPQAVQQRVPVYAAPAASQLPELSTDQVMFLRHLADKYIGEHAGNAAADSTTADNLKIAEETIFTIDQMIAAATARVAEPSVEIPAEASIATAEPVAAVPVAAVPVRATTVGYVQPAAFAPKAHTAQRGGYVAPRPDGRRVNVPASMRTGKLP